MASRRNRACAPSNLTSAAKASHGVATISAHCELFEPTTPKVIFQEYLTETCWKCVSAPTKRPSVGSEQSLSEMPEQLGRTGKSTEIEASRSYQIGGWHTG